MGDPDKVWGIDFKDGAVDNIYMDDFASSGKAGGICF
jgi:hypothetical protein